MLICLTGYACPSSWGPCVLLRGLHVHPGLDALLCECFALQVAPVSRACRYPGSVPLFLLLPLLLLPPLPSLLLFLLLLPFLLLLFLLLLPFLLLLFPLLLLLLFLRWPAPPPQERRSAQPHTMAWHVVCTVSW